MQSPVPGRSGGPVACIDDRSVRALDDEELLRLLVHEADSFGPGGEPVGEALARIEGCAPGWWSLAELESIDLGSLAPDDALSYLRIVVAHQGWLDARATLATAVAAGAVARTDRIPATDERPAIDITDAVREEVAAALRLAPVTAHGRIETARTLVRHLPATVAALERGQITGMQARVVADAVRQFDSNRVGELAPALEARVLPRASRGTVGDVRSAARTAIRRLDPDGASERARAARRDLDVQVWHDTMGVSTLSARLLTEQALAVAAAIDRAAVQSGDDVRTSGQRRSEALVALVLRPETDRSAAGTATAAASCVEPTGAAARASLSADVVLVMDLPTWLGLRDDPVAVLSGGTLPADVARDLAADGSFRRAVMDPVTGHLLDYGRRAYSVPEPLRRYLLMRDQTCRFPGCGRGSEGCQADHARPWDEGGSTSADNMGMLCQRHHQLKTHGGWMLAEKRHDGRTVWTSPQGRRYEVDPPLFIDPDVALGSTDRPDPPTDCDPGWSEPAT